VYTSIGLLDRVAQLRSDRVRRHYEEAVGGAAALVAYGHAEADALRGWLAHLRRPPGVTFVPFGVDAEYFAPLEQEADVDVVSIGADPQRDYALLARVAARLPQRRFRVVAGPEQAGALASAPQNVTVETSVPFAEVRSRLAGGRVVALPVRDNLYSGATTTLLQAMAMGRPVVVTRTAAIAQGYGLVDGENCRFVGPGDEVEFGRALEELLADPAAAASLGARAREHVVRELGWDRYVTAIEAVIRDCAASEGVD
jgi:glycosyltransferase involved in cell wall biosynthesis